MSQNESAPADMALQLYSVEQVPRNLPVWELIRNDLGRPSAQRIARALGVGISTVHRWNQAGSAPRVACLALFWLTRWGHSEIHTSATNDAILAAQLARSTKEQHDQLAVRFAVACQDLENTRALLSHARGTYPSGAPSHTDMDRVASSAAQAAVRSVLQLLAQALPAALAPAPVPMAQLDAGPGSPEAPPPTEHSGKSLGPARSVQPRPSAPPGAARSSSTSETSTAPVGGRGVILPPDCNQLDEFPPLLERGSKEPSTDGGAQARHASVLGKGVTGHASEREGPAVLCQALAGQTANSRQEGAQPAHQAAITVTRVVDGRVASVVKSEVTRPALSAEPLHRALYGPFTGAAPQPPAPRAPTTWEDS